MDVFKLLFLIIDLITSICWQRCKWCGRKVTIIFFSMMLSCHMPSRLFQPVTSVEGQEASGLSFPIAGKATWQSLRIISSQIQYIYFIFKLNFILWQMCWIFHSDWHLLFILFSVCNFPNHFFTIKTWENSVKMKGVRANSLKLAKGAKYSNTHMLE